MLRTLFFLLIIDTCCSAATVKMSVGWDGTYRVGRWTPVFVTASDPTPRNVILELYVSHDQNDGIRIRQNATISPSVTTFVLFAPIGVSRDDLSVTLRDAKTEQRLATATARDSFTSSHPLLADAVSQLVVISGSAETSQTIQTQLNDTGVIACRWTDPIRLPSIAMGYDAMNLLILNRPDLGKLAADQQEAMLDWIRGGGNLLCWIGPDALPGPGPLLNALPATVGSNNSLTVSSHALSARELTPALNAKPISLADGQIIGFQKRLGFGTITLLPLDPSTLNFEDPSKWMAFWSPLLSGAVDPLSRVGQENAADRYVEAVVETRQLLGDAAGSSHFDFGQIWLMLIVAAGIVGPLDWFVLKKLNRRAWTLSTAVGWTGFILLCGIGVVRASLDESAGIRWIELVDQADGITVARTRIVNRMGEAADPNPLDWCEPFAADMTLLLRAPSRLDLDLHEDQHGARTIATPPGKPVPRMLLSQSIAPSAPMISADLKLELKDGKPTLVGTITNLGQSLLGNPTIRTNNGSCALQPLAAGATVNIDLPLASGGNSPARVWNLATTRTSRIDDLLKHDEHLACFTATMADSNALHLRALIALK